MRTIEDIEQTKQKITEALNILTELERYGDSEKCCALDSLMKFVLKVRYEVSDDTLKSIFGSTIALDEKHI